MKSSKKMNKLKCKKVSDVSLTMTEYGEVNTYNMEVQRVQLCTKSFNKLQIHNVCCDSTDFIYLEI